MRVDSIYGEEAMQAYVDADISCKNSNVKVLCLDQSHYACLVDDIGSMAAWYNKLKLQIRIKQIEDDQETMEDESQRECFKETRKQLESMVDRYDHLIVIPGKVVLEFILDHEIGHVVFGPCICFKEDNNCRFDLRHAFPICELGYDKDVDSMENGECWFMAEYLAQEYAIEKAKAIPEKFHACMKHMNDNWLNNNTSPDQLKKATMLLNEKYKRAV